MKINDIISEGILGSIGKGLADIAAPGAIEKYQAARNSQAVGQQAQASQIAQQNILRQSDKYNKFADLYALRVPTVNGTKTTSMQDIARQLPKSGETSDPNRRWKAVTYVAQQLEKKGIKVTKSPTAPVTPVTPTPAASSVNINTITGIPKADSPTSAEQVKLQQKIQAAMQAQQR
jgi:hypothetical protein